jgi:hypothetical protein
MITERCLAVIVLGGNQPITTLHSHHMGLTILSVEHWHDDERDEMMDAIRCMMVLYI